jgi:hypothetical protein
VVRRGGVGRRRDVLCAAGSVAGATTKPDEGRHRDRDSDARTDLDADPDPNPDPDPDA